MLGGLFNIAVDEIVYRERIGARLVGGARNFARCAVEFKACGQVAAHRIFDERTGSELICVDCDAAFEVNARGGSHLLARNGESAVTVELRSGVCTAVKNGLCRLAHTVPLCGAFGTVCKHNRILGSVPRAGKFFNERRGIELQLIARADHYVELGGVLPADVAVGYEVCLAAPFFLHKARHKVIVAGVGYAAYARIARHCRLRAAFLQCHLEYLCIVFADGLFVCPYKEHLAVAVGLLVVEEAVLNVSYNALGLRALNNRRRYVAALEAVLRVIFVVAAAERRAVSIHTGAVPALRAEKERDVAHHSALLFGKFGVPGGRYYILTAPAVRAA